MMKMLVMEDEITFQNQNFLSALKSIRGPNCLTGRKLDLQSNVMIKGTHSKAEKYHSEVGVQS